MIRILPSKLGLKRQFLFTGLMFVLIFTSGCVYLRLLQVKRQLSDFNTYFQISEQKGLTLIFLKPVLLSGDIVWLMKSAPTSKEKTDGGELWKYVIEKRYPGPKNEKGNFDIPINMRFENEKLGQISFPERFLKYISKPLLIKMMRSMGDAEIDKSERRAGSRFQTRNSLEIPRKQQVLDVLGLPFSTQDSDDAYTFIYRYNFREEKTRTSGGEFNLVMGFYFQKEDNKLLKTETNLNGLSMSLNFSFDKTSKDKKNSTTK